MPPSTTTSPINYYAVLGLRHMNATQDEIRQNYRRLCLVHHPDKGGSLSEFQKVQQAYHVLSDPASRRQYDRMNLFGVRTSGFKRTGRPPSAAAAVSRPRKKARSSSSSNKPTTTATTTTTTTTRSEPNCSSQTPVDDRDKQTVTPPASIFKTSTLSSLSVSTLKDLAMKLGADIRGCLEKGELIKAIQECHTDADKKKVDTDSGGSDEQAVGSNLESNAEPSNHKEGATPSDANQKNPDLEAFIKSPEGQTLEECIDLARKEALFEAWTGFGAASAAMGHNFCRELSRLETLLVNTSKYVSDATARLQKLQLEVSQKAASSPLLAKHPTDLTLVGFVKAIQDQGEEFTKARRNFLAAGKCMDILRANTSTLLKDLERAQVRAAGSHSTALDSYRACHLKQTQLATLIANKLSEDGTPHMTTARVLDIVRKTAAVSNEKELHKVNQTTDDKKTTSSSSSSIPQVESAHPSSTGTVAAASTGTMPAASTGTMPAASTGTVAAASTGTVAAASTGTMPAASTGTMPAASTGTVAAASTGTMPAASTGTMPAASTGTVAAASTGTVAAASTGTVPAASTGTVPAASTGTVPAASTGTMPAAPRGTAPSSSSTGTVAAASTRTVPSPSTGTVIAAPTGTAPSSSTGAVAAASTRTAPSSSSTGAVTAAPTGTAPSSSTGAVAAASTRTAPSSSSTGTVAAASTRTAPSSSSTGTVAAASTRTAPSSSSTGTVAAAPTRTAPSSSSTGAVAAAPRGTAPSSSSTGTAAAASTRTAPSSFFTGAVAAAPTRTAPSSSFTGAVAAAPTRTAPSSSSTGAVAAAPRGTAPSSSSTGPVAAASTRTVPSSSTGTVTAAPTGTALSSFTRTVTAAPTGTVPSSSTGTVAEASTRTVPSSSTGTVTAAPTGTAPSSFTRTVTAAPTWTAPSSSTGTVAAASTRTAPSSSTGTVAAAPTRTAPSSSTGTVAAAPTRTAPSSFTVNVPTGFKNVSGKSPMNSASGDGVLTEVSTSSSEHQVVGEARTPEGRSTPSIRPSPPENVSSSATQDTPIVVQHTNVPAKPHRACDTLSDGGYKGKRAESSKSAVAAERQAWAVKEADSSTPPPRSEASQERPASSGGINVNASKKKSKKPVEGPGIRLKASLAADSRKKPQLGASVGSGVSRDAEEDDNDKKNNRPSKIRKTKSSRDTIKVRIPYSWKRGSRVRFAVEGGTVEFVPMDTCSPGQIVTYNKTTAKLFHVPEPLNDAVEVISLE